MSDPLVAVDLFCGAGGLSEGLAEEVEDVDRDVVVHAVNHWERAIETHKRNHPDAHHYHAKIEQLQPREVVSEDSVEILTAGPECTHFSTARGGKPVDAQKRASPWHVIDWMAKLLPENVLIENVPEFEQWGPVVNDQPTRNGQFFDAWIETVRGLGYSVDWRTLNAADYGDPTCRERLFIVARRDTPPAWPEATHSQDGTEPGTKPWRPAADIIDWSNPGGSIWTRDLHDARKRPLKNSTIQRIAEGIRRHCDDRLAAFADVLDGIGRDEVRYLREHRVVPERYAGIVAQAVDAPFLVAVDDRPPVLSTAATLGQQSNYLPWAADRPLPTVATGGKIALLGYEGTRLRGRPLVMPRNGAHRGLHSNPLYRPEDRPLHTVTAKNTDGYLVTPSLVRYSHGGASLSVDDPMPTIATERGGVYALSSPYLVKYYGTSPPVGVDRPLDTVTSGGGKGGGHFALTSPQVRLFLDDYEGPPRSLDRPLGTLTTRDRFALCVPELYPWGLDVRYRMLQPRELKQAQGFPADYDITGNKRETTEQIGNAVPVNLARSLVSTLLGTQSSTLQDFADGERVAADGGESA